MYRTIVAGSDGSRARPRGGLARARRRLGRRCPPGAGGRPPQPPAAVSRAPTPSSARSSSTRSGRSATSSLPEAVVHIACRSLARPRPASRRRGASGADLLVVGSRHRRRLQRILEGDRAMQVLHGAPCAAAVAPDPLRAPPASCGASASGSTPRPSPSVALAMARDLAERTGARLWLHARGRRHRSPPGPGSRRWPVPPTSTSRSSTSRVSAARELLAERLERLPGRARRRDGRRRLARRASSSWPARGSTCSCSARGAGVPCGAWRSAAPPSASSATPACPVLVPPRDAASEHGDAASIGDEAQGR